jgi:hypothetical protein
MAVGGKNPWRRGPAVSTNGIPLAAQSAVPLTPNRGNNTFGFFVKERYTRVKSRTTPYPSRIPIAAQSARVKNGLAV